MVNSFFKPGMINRSMAMIVTVCLFFALPISASDARMEKMLADKNYEQAHAYIMSILGGSAEQNYYKGLLLYHMDKDMDNALIYLTRALQANGPERARLVLGMVMHRLYRFDDAIRILNEYIATSRDSEGKEVAAQFITYCENGNSVAHRGRVVQMKHLQKAKAGSLPVAMNQYESNVVILPKPQNLFSKTDEKAGDNKLLMVMPKDASKVSHVYFSAYVPGKTPHSDIFRARLYENGEFGEPENLGNIINSSMDEISPFFDNDKQALYFASKGHQSIGGFDIFVSYYNAGTEAWSKPVNLGFPINSTSDDYFFIPIKSQGDYFFVTNRGVPDNEVQLAKVNIPAGAQYKSYISHIDKVNVAKIDIAPPSEGEVFAMLVDDKSFESKELPLQEVAREEVQQVVYTPVVAANPARNTDEYHKLVNDALFFQVKADSVNRRINEQHERIRLSFSETRRQQLTAELNTMQATYNQLKSEADKQYKLVRQYEARHGIISDDARLVSQSHATTTGAVPDNVTEGEIPGSNETPSTLPGPAHTYSIPVSTGHATIKEGEGQKPSFTHAPTLPQGTVKPSSEAVKPTTLEKVADLPPGVVYSIQVGVYSRVVEKSTFKGLGDIFYYLIPGRGLYRFYSGFYTDAAQASRQLASVKAAGFKDAFVVAFYNNEPVSLERASQLK